jgi:tRNA(Ile)-lysidine synthetase-like protein
VNFCRCSRDASHRSDGHQKLVSEIFFRLCIVCTYTFPFSAVANSGGPDSTCLLFLLKRLLSDEKMTGKGLPLSVVSLTVDHGLQASSSSMANQCSKNSAALKVQHLTVQIPWSEPPFPPRPSDTGSFEGIARDARFHVLFHAMTRVGVRKLAFGHHADDQVETSLMRLARGTTEIGAGGMRPCRRWGMGLDQNKLGWAGHEGMRRWIVRPLLEVSKVGIVALMFIDKPYNIN